MYTHIREHSLYLYADDTAIIANDPNFATLNCKLQNYATNLESWCENNRLNINVGKSKVMHFSPGRHQSNCHTSVFINNSQLEQFDKYKYLGYILDNRLQFDYMLTDTLNKLNNTLRIFKLIRPSLNNKAAIMVSKSKVISLIDYILIFTYLLSKKGYKRLQTIQNRFIRCTLNLPKRTILTTENTFT